MKKTSLRLIMGVFVILMLSACQKSNSPQKEISHALGIDISNGTVETYNDSHGGFHGDGTSYASIRFPDDSIAKKLSESNAWKPLPLSENLSVLIYGNTTKSGHTGSYLTDKDGKDTFPEVKNGYYYFIDRHDQSTDSYDDTNILDRYSFNFTIAIYDTDTDTLYFAELDT